MSAKVESWFIEPLEKHYEIKAKVGARVTIMQELERYSEAALGKAQNWLKVNRKAQTFPSPAECISACKQFEVMALSVSDGQPGTGSYGERVKAWAKARSKDAKYQFFKFDTDEMRAWRRYWEDNEQNAFLDFTRDLGKEGTWTFPTQWPWEFDLGYVAGDPEGRDD